MKFKINTYFATLLVTVVGAGASLIIIHVANANTFVTTMGGSEAAYTSLQDSILNP